MRNKNAMKKTIALLLSIFITAATASAQLTGPLNKTNAESNFAQYLRLSSVDGTADKGTTEPLEEFNNVENTKGRRFLFNTWATGSNVSDKQGQPMNISSYLFNYDELTGSLLATENKKDILSVTPGALKSFTLEYRGKQYAFAHIGAIDSTRFYLRLAGGDGMYALYKECKVRFVKSNYRNDGIIQSGNPNDEYIDESQYYIIRPNEETGRIVFKPSDIKNILVAEKEKVKAYFNQHSDDPVDEYFLTDLITSLNKE